MPYRRPPCRPQTPAGLVPGAGLCLLLLTWVLWFWLLTPGSAIAGSQVVVASYEGVINPVAAEYVRDALDYASAVQAQALILQLDTPGGLDTSMRSIIKDFTASPIPVILYVAPSGGRAASAGVFLTLAAHLAAMAPGTNIGAAHPVAMGGGEMDKTMKEKVENDSAAYIKSLAEQHGRNVKWAEDAVRKSVSATEKEALSLKIIDLVAEDLPALLKAIDGRAVMVGNRKVTLHTAQSSMEPFSMSLRLHILKTLSDPNIAYILMTLGTVGLLAELYNPGAILPGVVGAISLILAFYSFQSLPVNYAGVLLILLGIVFFILEALVVSFGILAIGGVTAMVLGSLMLMKTDAEFLQISWSVIIPVVAAAAGLSLLIVGVGLRALRRKPMTGLEEMIGLVGEARTTVAPRGQIVIHGELWDAVSEVPLQPGDAAEVTRVEGLRLHVKPVLRRKEA
ncbi:putative membrane-bound ClpP-class protease associated with aq_911 [Nitrospira tepida]|uniref:Membrane-bound ClpP-class protease associated with aq_911 n=1 Tax=Nitrospira tepida TaxID=2973512 RepID=A0AA86MWL7_9BACT|nr:nodulation protein NfeD [Nitrospira tepida]CAI4030234.1 putative membrane-bound ClpP-class protease associated with aq_911 [Nitrospira tepida]